MGYRNAVLYPDIPPTPLELAPEYTVYCSSWRSGHWALAESGLCWATPWQTLGQEDCFVDWVLGGWLASWGPGAEFVAGCHGDGEIANLRVVSVLWAGIEVGCHREWVQTAQRADQAQGEHVWACFHPDRGRRVCGRMVIIGSVSAVQLSVTTLIDHWIQYFRKPVNN